MSAQGKTEPVDPKLLERRANVVRSRLLRTIDALDSRRHQVEKIGLQAKKLALWRRLVMGSLWGAAAVLVAEGVLLLWPGVGRTAKLVGVAIFVELALSSVVLGALGRREALAGAPEQRPEHHHQGRDQHRGDQGELETGHGAWSCSAISRLMRARIASS